MNILPRENVKEKFADQSTEKCASRFIAKNSRSDCKAELFASYISEYRVFGDGGSTNLMGIK